MNHNPTLVPQMVQGSGGTTGMMLMTQPHWRGKECESLPSIDARGQRGPEGLLLGPRFQAQVS